jgi:hypothetical protein
MVCMGFQIWPPQWSNSNQSINPKAVLTDVKFILGTDLFRIDVDHNGIPHLGIMIVGKEVRKPLYDKLKENVGRKLVEIGDLDIEIGQEAADSYDRGPNGWDPKVKPKSRVARKL